MDLQSLLARALSNSSDQEVLDLLAKELIRRGHPRKPEIELTKFDPEKHTISLMSYRGQVPDPIQRALWDLQKKGWKFSLKTTGIPIKSVPMPILHILLKDASSGAPHHHDIVASEFGEEACLALLQDMYKEK